MSLLVGADICVHVWAESTARKSVLGKAVRNGSLSSPPPKSVTSILFIGFYSCRRFTAYPINYPPGMIKLDGAVILHYVLVLFHVVSLNDW